MLPRQFRLSKKEFETVRTQGVLRSGRLMGLLVYEPRTTRLQSLGAPATGGQVNHGPSAPAKAGIIVSNKLSKKATERNRLKRRIRAALARVLPELSNIHIVVLPTRRAMGVGVGELQKELMQLMNQESGKKKSTNKGDVRI